MFPNITHEVKYAAEKIKKNLPIYKNFRKMFRNLIDILLSWKYLSLIKIYILYFNLSNCSLTICIK